MLVGRGCLCKFSAQSVEVKGLRSFASGLWAKIHRPEKLEQDFGVYCTPYVSYSRSPKEF